MFRTQSGYFKVLREQNHTVQVKHKISLLSSETTPSESPDLFLPATALIVQEVQVSSDWPKIKVFIVLTSKESAV